MASEDDQPLYNDDDFDVDDDDDDSEPLNGAVPDEVFESSSDEDDDSSTFAAVNSTAVTVAIPSSSSSISVAIPPPLSSSSAAVTVALPEPQRLPLIIPPEKKPIDDSRRLFQRLWTDEDEIELLQGFLEYTSSRGTTSSGHHHDTAAFYDQIKSKLQLDFNKNQLVEKLRRLKKKFRNVLSKMSSGKDFVFKSPHDQATFELSRKIWSNLSSNYPAVADLVVDDDEQTPPRAPSSSFAVNHINLNSAAGATTMVVDNKASGGSYNHSNNNNSNNVPFDVMMSNFNSPAAKLSTRKRPRVAIKEEKFVRNVAVEGGGNVSDNSNVINNMSNANINNNNNNIGSGSGNVNLGSTMQGLIEEAVRSCLSPMLKDLVNNAVNGAVFGGGGGGGGSLNSRIKGVGALALNAVPLNFSVANVGGSSCGDVMDDKWRKQQILELEVYSKRLELVQDQIKLSLEELRATGS